MIGRSPTPNTDDVGFTNRRHDMLGIAIENLFKEVNEEANRNSGPLASNLLGHQNTHQRGYWRQDVHEGGAQEPQPYLEGGGGRECPHVSYVECQPGGYSNGRSPGQQDFQHHTRKKEKIHCVHAQKKCWLLRVRH